MSDWGRQRLERERTTRVGAKKEERKKEREREDVSEREELGVDGKE